MRIRQNLLSAQANNFTAVRLLLASAVIYTHCYVLLNPGPDRDEFSTWLGAPISTYAVDGFFFLSGFLVYPSLIRFGNAGKFLMARVARLWPALCLVVLLTVAGGALLTQAHGLSYLGGATSRFVLGNLSFVKAYYTLTGVICGVDPCNVNQSLWTLPFEARCYLILAILGLIGLAAPRRMLAIVLPLTLLAAAAWDFSAVRDLGAHVLGSGLAYIVGEFHRLWPVFALGCVAWIVRERLVLSWWILGLLLAAVLASVALGLGIAMQVRGVFIGYAVLCLGLLTAEKGAFAGRWPDYSYGTYIYAAPVMMLIHAALDISQPWLLSLVNLALTAPLAAFSWHVLEKPAMDAFRRWNGRGRKVAAPQT
jgi:peptidoglycan/LPS O-acetylase OafA/YrhL